MEQHQTWIGHLVSAGAIAAAMWGWLPSVSALAGLVWFSIQIWESRTVQSALLARRIRKIAQLQARITREQNVLAEQRVRVAQLGAAKVEAPGGQETG